MAKSQWDILGGSSSDPLEVRLKSGSGGATHMALLRGVADTSWVLHSHRGRGARLWLAQPMQDSTQGVWVPVVNSENLSDTVDTFCAGQAVMADGRLMVVGGTVVGTTGETRVPVFNPKDFRGSSTHGWTLADSVKHGRWYATVTPLSDGKLLTTSGTQFMNLVMFGGRKTEGGDSLMNDVRTLNLTNWPLWENDMTSAPRPSTRHGHTAVFHHDAGRTVFFGGMQGAILLNDVHQVFIRNTDTAVEWTWESVTTVGDAGQFPQPRHRHTAVVVDSTMIVYGGVGFAGQVLSDLWRLNLNSRTWKKDVISGGPGARYGHTAVMDNLESGPSTPAMLVYGGRTGTSSFASDAVWKLTIDRTNSAAPISWSQLSTTGVSPGSREGHVAVMDTVDKHTNPAKHRMVVFGGEKTDSLKNDVWTLSRSEPDPGTAWTWSLVTPDSAPPAARTRAVGVYDAEWERLLVIGGDTTRGAAGGEVNDAWGLRIDLPTRPWQKLTQHNLPVARQGAAAVFDHRPVQAKVPELYTPGAADHDWQQLSTNPKWMSNYPFMHLTKTGKLLYGGNNGPGGPGNHTSYLYDPATQSWSDPKDSEILGGSSVLTYAPGEQVMKCGSTDHHFDTPLTSLTRVAVVDSANLSTSWNPGQPIPEPRRFLNLTIVPDGRVLLTGGWYADGFGADGKRNYSLTPFFYKNGVWEDPPISQRLAGDLVRRSYHSTALLLPDARILCAGGPPVDDTLTATVFTPPYLYRNGTQLADRPSITAAPSVVHYGEPFYIGVDTTSAKKIVSLIRPGAVTHSLDMNQRYVQQSFAKYVADDWLRTVLSGNPNQVPPGDYLLFVVDSTSSGNVPSVGKWIRIESEIDATRPAGRTMSIGGVSASVISVSWMAPGDDSLSGTASAYDLRYRTDGPVTEANFGTSTPVGTDPPRPKGSVELYAVTSLPTCTTHYFGLKTRDEWNNWSSLTTGSASTSGCGGGGGGCEFCEELPPSARPVQGHLVTHHEILRLGKTLATSITLTHAGAAVMQIDSLEVIAVPHGADSIAATVGGELRLGTIEPAMLVASGAVDISEALSRSDYTTAIGETLLVRFAALGEAGVGSALVLDAEPVGGEGGIRVLVPRGENRWRAIARVSPAMGQGVVVVEDVGSDEVRLAFGAGYRLKGVARVRPGARVNATGNVPLAAAEHSRLGAVALPQGGPSVVLEPGDVLRLETAAHGVAAADRFLRFRISGASSTPARQSSVATHLPVAFALGQNEPNPFGDGTVIRFALPTASPVAIEVFDVNGRRVRTLTKAEWQAGSHALNWDGRDAEGRQVSPGVYLYRMAAGSFHASRKLVVLP